MPTIWAPFVALVIVAAPAQAQRWSDPNFVAAANVTVHRANPMVGNGDRHEGSRSRNDHGRNGHSSSDGGWWGGWYDPDLNRSWDEDSYNDWWHDRPDRAYPRWVQHNDGCEENRMWQGGGVWRCSW